LRGGQNPQVRQCYLTLLIVEVLPDGAPHHEIEHFTTIQNAGELGEGIVEPLDTPRPVPPCPRRPERSDGLNGKNTTTSRSQPRRIASGARADVDHGTGRFGEHIGYGGKDIS